MIICMCVMHVYMVLLVACFVFVLGVWFDCVSMCVVVVFAFDVVVFGLFVLFCVCVGLFVFVVCVVCVTDCVCV